MKRFLSAKFQITILIVLGLTFAEHTAHDRFYLTPILMYHHIDGRSEEWKLSVSPESFEKQMEYLKKHNYKVLELEDYIRRIKKGGKIERKTVVITFDDGYDNNHTNALPILKKFGFPATIFIQVDGTGRDGYMTRDEVADLIRSNIHIGSHTLHHPFLPDVPAEQKKTEITESKALLENEFNVPITLFSYPGGGFDEEARQLVIDAGYEGAVATHPGWDYPNKDPYALKRIRISRTADNPFVFWIQLSGFYTYIEELRG